MSAATVRVPEAADATSDLPAVKGEALKTVSSAVASPATVVLLSVSKIARAWKGIPAKVPRASSSDEAERLAMAHAQDWAVKSATTGALMSGVPLW